MRQPIDEIDIVLRQHDIIEVLVSAGHIETEAEFSLFASYRSSFESEQKKQHYTSESRTPKRSFLGYDEDIYIRIFFQRVERDGIAEIYRLNKRY